MISTIFAVALAAAQAVVASEPQNSTGATPTEQTPANPAPEQQPLSSNATAMTSPSVGVGPLPTGLILWRNVESAMPVARLRALYPAGKNVVYKEDRTVLGDVTIIEGCEAKVNIMHPKGIVEEIVMRGEGSLAGRCSLKVITALSGKYGEPLEKDKVKGSLFAREGKNYVWSRDGITLQLKRYTNGALGGGGLFAASWELRYAPNAVAIDL